MAGKKDMVAPEGGWGYMICIGLVLITGIPLLMVNTFGLLFNSILIQDGKNSNVPPLVAGICGFLIAASGIMVSTLMRWFSLRQIALMGTILQTVSCIINIFIPKAEYLILTNGVMNGISLGFSQTTGYIAFNMYFVKKRVFFMSVCMALIALSAIVFPLVMNYWLEEFGFIWARAFLAAFSGNAVFGAMLLQPVEWHLVPRTDEEDIPMKDENQTKHQLKPLLENVEVSPVSVQQKSRLTTFLENTNLRIFRKFTFCNICLGMGFCLKSDIYFSIFLSIFLFDFNFTQTQIATLLSIVSFSDLISRILMGLVGKCIKINSFHIYYACMIITTLVRLWFLQIDTYMWTCVVLSVLGFLKAWVWIFYPILVAEEMPKEDLTSAFSIAQSSTFLFNIIYTASSSITLMITGSYRLTFYFLALSGLLPIIPWTIELLIVRPLKRKNNKIIKGLKDFIC